MRILLIALCLTVPFSIFAETKKIKVGSSPTVSSAGIYLALEKGFFKEEGLDIDLLVVNNSGAPMTLLLAKGELDVGAGNFSSGLFNAILQGSTFKIVADKGHVEKGKEYMGLLVRKDLIDSGRFKTLKDLKGLKVSLTSLDGVSQQIVMDGFLKKAGLTEKDIQYLKLSYAESNVALRTKNIDATIQLEPYLTRAVLDQTAINFASSQEVAPDQQSAGIFYSPQFMKNRYPEAVQFMKAYLRGVRLYNQGLKDPAVWKDVTTALKKHIKIEDDRVWNKMIPVGIDNDGRILVENLSRDLDWYRKKGYISAVPNMSSVVDESFRRQAVKELDTPKAATKK